jgi:FtsP/CotA-like multicopper oxidase with cupredoxin domain
MNADLICENRVFIRGQTYDIYVINPTNDYHPMHAHLTTTQIVGRIPIRS